MPLQLRSYLKTDVSDSLATHKPSSIHIRIDAIRQGAVNMVCVTVFCDLNEDRLYKVVMLRIDYLDNLTSIHRSR